MSLPRWKVGAAAALLCAPLAAGAAHAQQSPASRGAPAEVRAAALEFQRGVRLLDARRFAEAAAAFERSLAIRESASALYDLGLARRGESAPRRALASFERFLAVARPDNAARPGAAAIVAELRRAVARAAVTARGGSAEVLVDGDRVASADGSVELTLDPGAHTFEARRPGYAPAREERVIGRGESAEVALDASARPLTAHLVVEVDNRAAVVRVDGVAQPAGRFEGEVSAGSHLLEVLVSGAVVRRRTARLAPGGSERWPVVVTLPTTREGPAEPSPSLLRNGWLWVGAGGVVVGLVIVAVATSGTDRAYDGGSWNTVIQGSSSGR